MEKNETVEKNNWTSKTESEPDDLSPWLPKRLLEQLSSSDCLRPKNSERVCWFKL